MCNAGYQLDHHDTYLHATRGLPSMGSPLPRRSLKWSPGPEPEVPAASTSRIISARGDITHARVPTRMLHEICPHPIITRCANFTDNTPRVVHDVITKNTSDKSSRMLLLVQRTQRTGGDIPDDPKNQINQHHHFHCFLKSLNVPNASAPPVVSSSGLL